MLGATSTTRPRIACSRRSKARRRYRARDARAHRARPARVRRGDRSAAGLAARNVKRGTLSDDLRRARLLPPPVLGATREALAAVRESLDELTACRWCRTRCRRRSRADPGFKVCVVDEQRLFGVDADVFVGRPGPRRRRHRRFPQPTVVIDRSFVERARLPLRFLFGRAFEAIRGGYALLTAARPSAPRSAHLLGADASPRASASRGRRVRAQAAAQAAKVLERQAGPRDVDPGWIAALRAAAKRAGLVACDDFGAATRMVARLGGEELAVLTDDTVALGQVLGGPDLVRFFLSDPYHELRSTLRDWRDVYEQVVLDRSSDEVAPHLPMISASTGSLAVSEIPPYDGGNMSQKFQPSVQQPRTT